MQTLLLLYMYMYDAAAGTYNNQYMVIDLKLFKPNVSLEPNALWVVEQIPGMVVSEDQTDILRLGTISGILLSMSSVDLFFS